MSSEYIPVALKQVVFDRAKGICEYCRSQSKFAIDPLITEHIQPVSRGGKTAEDNLALACQTCNNYKHTKTEAIDPVTNELVPLFHPRQMLWYEHFSWNDAVTQMMGNTPIGRTTINLLKTNRESVMNIRRVLAIMGFHPSD
jgi:HNH endonuclease